MANVYISSNDPMLLDVMTEQETIDTFGPDFINDYGNEIPDDLLERYQKAKDEFWNVQNELKAYYHG